MAAADQRAANVLPVIREIQKGGTTSLYGIATMLNQRGIKTARGGSWTHVQVNHVLERKRLNCNREQPYPADGQPKE